MDARNSVGTTCIRPLRIREEEWGVSFNLLLLKGTRAMSEKPGFSLLNDLTAEHASLW
jgi:hypothetical protein